MAQFYVPSVMLLPENTFRRHKSTYYGFSLEGRLCPKCTCLVVCSYLKTPFYDINPLIGYDSRDSTSISALDSLLITGRDLQQ